MDRDILLFPKAIEEIKAVLDLNLGYQINIIEAHRYSRGDIFSKFVKHFIPLPHVKAMGGD